MKHLMLKLASGIASLAVMATTLNVNSTWHAYCPSSKGASKDVESSVSNG